MLAFIVGCVCVLAFSVLIALLCCRRRFQKATANGGRAGHHHPVLNGCAKQHRKKLNLNGGVVMDRYGILELKGINLAHAYRD
jgi:hypothetical protein